jgi:hypothetical protein
MSSPEYESKESGLPSDLSQDELESAGTPVVVDKMTERKLMRKLDLRIVPMVMWIYLMNFMDRGKTSRILLISHANYSQ